MNISSMKELDHLTVDKIADAFGRVNCKCSDFTRINEYTYDPITDRLVGREVSGEERIPRRLLREAETIYEEMAKKEYDKMYKNSAKIPNCTGIIQRDRATIVTWDDNTKTIVAEKGFDENEHMLFDAFCIAFTKKMLGSTTKILNTIKENDTDTIKAARKKAIEEANKKAEEEAKAALEKEANDTFEAAVQQKMFEKRVIEEAIRRISIREARRVNNDYVHVDETNKKEE